MPKVIYDGPFDEFDAKNIVGHALKFYPVGGAAEVRPRGVKGGQPQEVPEDKVEELLSYPNHRFRLLEDASAAKPAEPSAQGSTDEVDPIPVIDAETGESVRNPRAKKGGS